MKYVFRDIVNIKKILKNNIVLLLDFDLTLSPLAQNPTHAFLPKNIKGYLTKIIKHTPIVIITGRKLSDIKKKVNIKGMLYAGNNGMEHNLNIKYKISADISVASKKALLRTKREMKKINKKYPEIIFEDKKYSIALGYRQIKSTKIQSVELLFKKIQNEIRKEGLLETHLDKKTFEVRLKNRINKGTACLMAISILQNKLHKRIIPIYIGDSRTDEDAFKILKTRGMTIKVGRNKNSTAKWYLRNQAEVITFLRLVDALK